MHFMHIRHPVFLLKNLQVKKDLIFNDYFFASYFLGLRKNRIDATDTLNKANTDYSILCVQCLSS